MKFRSTICILKAIAASQSALPVSMSGVEALTCSIWRSPFPNWAGAEEIGARYRAAYPFAAAPARY